MLPPPPFPALCPITNIPPPSQAGIIITARLALISIASLMGSGYFLPISCDQLASRYLIGSREEVLNKFPACEAYFSGINPDQVVTVEASMNGDGVANVRAALNMSFGTALWLGLFIHAVGVEFYVCLSFHIQYRSHR